MWEEGTTIADRYHCWFDFIDWQSGGLQLVHLILPLQAESQYIFYAHVLCSNHARHSHCVKSQCPVCLHHLLWCIQAVDCGHRLQSLDQTRILFPNSLASRTDHGRRLTAYVRHSPAWHASYPCLDCPRNFRRTHCRSVRMNAHDRRQPSPHYIGWTETPDWLSDALQQSNNTSKSNSFTASSI